jgi:hypothetical protein
MGALFHGIGDRQARLAPLPHFRQSGDESCYETRMPVAQT